MAPAALENLALETATMRRVTIRIVPFLMLCYFIAFVDRVNVGFAALQMNKDVGLRRRSSALAAHLLPWLLPVRGAEQPCSGKSRGADLDRAHHDHLGPVLRCYCFRRRPD